MNATHTIRLTNGANFLRLEMTRGLSTATLHNSAGEAACIGRAEAQQRIATLIDAGWRAE